MVSGMMMEGVWNGRTEFQEERLLDIFLPKVCVVRLDGVE